MSAAEDDSATPASPVSVTAQSTPTSASPRTHTLFLFTIPANLGNVCLAGTPIEQASSSSLFTPQVRPCRRATCNSRLNALFSFPLVFKGVACALERPSRSLCRRRRCQSERASSVYPERYARSAAAALSTHALSQATTCMRGIPLAARYCTLLRCTPPSRISK